jgi:hypothetical protein
MYEHGELSEGFSVVDLSSGEEDATLDTSWDEEVTHRLFCDLNYDRLGLLDDDNASILSDIKEE